MSTTNIHLNTPIQKENTDAPRLSVPAPIELCVKWYGVHHCFLLRSHFTPFMSMEGGLSVIGDCQCSYTGKLIGCHGIKSVT